MSILTYRPAELATSRKITSDLANNTDELTFNSRSKNSSHGIAAKAVRDRADNLNIKFLSTLDVDGAEYYDDLEH